MKTAIITFLALVISQSAFATHAYRSETCESQTHSLKYKGNYPLGGAYGLSLKGSNVEVEIWDINDSENQDVDGDNKLQIVGVDVRSTKVVEAECGSNNDGVDFEETLTESVKKIKFVQLSSDDELKLGIKSGTDTYLRCSETFSMPVRCEK